MLFILCRSSALYRMKHQQVVQVYFTNFQGSGRVRVGQIKVLNMCSLRLLDTKTGVDPVCGKAGNPRALASENSHLCYCFVLFS
jgi:hypothetical protein